MVKRHFRLVQTDTDRFVIERREAWWQRWEYISMSTQFADAEMEFLRLVAVKPFDPKVLLES